MHVSAISIAPGPPSAALDTVGDRLIELCDRGWCDYFFLGGGPAHSWRLQHADPDGQGNVEGVERCERLPSPLPDSLITAVYVSPASRVYWSPLAGEPASKRRGWVQRLNRNVLRGARDGCCLVLADLHC